MFNKNNPLYQEDLVRIRKTPGFELFANKRFLITGATGLIGVPMIDALMALEGVHIYAIGRNRERAIERLGEHFTNPNFTFIEQDINQPFNSELHADYIIPLASNTHPIAYSKYPIETMLTNLKGTIHALDAAAQWNAAVLYPSSVEVYGDARGTETFTEDYTGMLNLSNSRACYPESKRASEALCLSYCSEYKTNVKIVRLSRVFGPTILASDSKASSQFINKAVSHENIVLKSNGDQLFSYVYVADAVAAMLYVLLHGEKGKTYNVSNNNCIVQLRDFAIECAQYAGTTVTYNIPDDIERKGYSISKRAVLDNSKLQQIGFTPQYSFHEAIARTLDILTLFN